MKTGTHEHGSRDEAGLELEQLLKNVCPLMTTISDIPQPFGSVNRLATLVLQYRLGVAEQLIDPSVSLFTNCLDTKTIQIGPNYVSALSQFTRTDTAWRLMMTGQGRTEVHGTHTIPACVEIGKLLLGTPQVDELEIVRHQISKPIHSQLTLLAYRKLPTEGFPESERCLFAQLRLNGDNIFIRGYQTEQPIVYVLTQFNNDEHTTRPLRLLSRNAHGAAVLYFPEPSRIECLDKLEQSPTIDSVALLNRVELIGSKLLFKNFFPLSGGDAYVSRIMNCKGMTRSLLVAEESELLITYEHSSLRRIGGAELLDISFAWKAGIHKAEGTLTLASVPDDSNHLSRRA